MTTWQPSSAPVPSGEIIIERGSTAKDLGPKLNRSAADIMRFLFLQGEIITAVQALTEDMIELYAAEVGATVRIVDPIEARALNHDYRHKDYATNILTFDYATEPVVCADLVLCADVVAQEAGTQNKSLQAHYAHLLVHGTLHAQGWDHETSEADAEAMEAQEIAILARLGIDNPYQE